MIRILLAAAVLFWTVAAFTYPRYTHAHEGNP